MAVKREVIAAVSKASKQEELFGSDCVCTKAGHGLVRDDGQKFVHKQIAGQWQPFGGGGGGGSAAEGAGANRE